MNENNIKELCNKYDIKVSFSPNVIFLQTKIACWRLYHDGIKVDRVYHENYRSRKIDYSQKGFSTKFHRQQVKETSYNGVIRYIYNHDRKYVEKTKKVTRMEMLFKQIEIQNQSKIS